MKQFEIINKVVIITGAAGLLAEQHIEVVLENKAIAVLIDINEKKVKKKNPFILKNLKIQK